ncbi:uncharacterized protein LOC105664962 [Ceratitis capitata]|uniref:uncharacterized protein LOC105664962 n=1 Tax=Ceratitis capitata TaxID=7213 RepID=UPI000618834B|nr:uncharacterized protein LOC105664962 [Ceratitis capitata]
MAFSNNGIDFDFLLTEDFLLFLDLCRDPNQVFRPNSDESCLAQNWLDKLCRYECADLEERRLRNIYMSYLCCCLIEGVLKGPFANQPNNGRLQMTNFNATKKQALSCPVVCKERRHSVCEDSKSIRFSDNCEQQQLGSCFSNAINVGGSANCEVMRCPPEVRFGPNIKCEPDSTNGSSTKRSSANVFSNYMLREITSPSAYNSFASHRNSGPCDLCENYDPYAHAKESLRQDVAALLEAIQGELSGYVESGCNKYLESELLRYKNFIMNFSSIACVLNNLKSQPALRSFLLINLQNDLIKLISDGCI